MTRRPRHLRERISPRAWLLLGLFVVGLAAWLAREFHRLYELAQASTGWPVAEGRILESKVVRGAKGRKRARIRYRYDVEGRVYQGRRVQFLLDVLDNTAGEQVARWAPQTSAPIRYDPGDPSRSVLVPGARPDQVWGGALLLLVLFGGGLCMTGWSVKKLRARDRRPPAPAVPAVADSDSIEDRLLSRM